MTSSDEKFTLRYGYGRRNINPNVPISLAGYFTQRMWTGVLDDIEVRALVLAQGDRLAAIVQFDLVAVPFALTRMLREAIGDIPGLDPLLVAFTATHTHTAPEIRTDRPGNNASYNSFLVEQTKAAIREAATNLRPGQVALGKTWEERFAFNRRYWMKNGKVVTNPPRCHPDILKPEGPIDPEIPLLGITEDGRVRVLLANIVNHADTTGGCLVSADWPGVFRRQVEEHLGFGSMVMPLIGTSGNINHFDVRVQRDQTNPNEARRIGEGYAATVVAGLSSLRPCEGSRVCVARRTFKTGPREITEAELAEARKHAALQVENPNRPLTSEDLAVGSPAALKYFGERTLALAADRAEREYEVIGMGVGDAIMVFLPGEPFVEVGLELKRTAPPGKTAFVVSLTNASAGYIPNRFNFGRGGYETAPRSSPNSIETADRLIEAARKVMAEVSLE